MVWRFYDPKEIEQMDKKGGHFKNKKLCQENKNTADLAAFSIMKALAKSNKYEHILQYRKDPRIINKLGPNFKVKLTFGLHQGWAIEGAIGSFFKIDASYLSPNVNMASRLCAATKQFGCDFLLSGDMHDILSDGFQSQFLEIDKVTVKGSIKPIRMYTCVLDLDGLKPEGDKMLKVDMKIKKALRMQARDTLLSEIDAQESTTLDLLKTDIDFREMRRNHSQEVEDRFKEGYQAYLSGDWSTCGSIMDELVAQNPKHGPIKNLHKIVCINHGKRAPSDWKGYRALTSK